MPTTYVIALEVVGIPGNLVIPADVTELDELLIIGGGGGGGSHQGGGGGSAGQILHLTNVAVTPGSFIPYIVGQGGTGAPDSTFTYGNDGLASQFGSYVSEGGVGGAPTSNNGRNGFLGSGAGRSTSSQTGGVGSLGFDGGNTDGSNTYGAGGAGNSENGEDGLSSNGAGGKGGDGLFFSQFSAYGASGWFGGGGGGSGGNNEGNGGQGGGGDGGSSTAGWAGKNGLDGTGGGGGGGGRFVGGLTNAPGGDGGDGIIIVVFTSDLPYPPLPPYEPSKEELFTLQNALQLRFAGGETPEQSLGGNSPAVAGPQSGQMENLFRVPSEGELAAGVTQYCCFFVVNDTDRSWTRLAIDLEPLLWIHRGPLDADAELSIGVDPANPGDPSAVVADEFTAPSGVSFSAPDNEGDALVLGTLEPGTWKAIWLRRVLAPGHAEVRYDRATLALKTEWEPD